LKWGIWEARNKKFKEKNRDRRDIVTSLDQRMMTVDVAAAFCTIRIRTGQGEWMADGDIHAAS
jgi:hypothetical protein